MKYEKIKYPDGQISVKITEFTAPYIINERINSYEDLFFIRSIVEALHSKSIKNIHLVIPCLFGQRSDRRFTEGQSFDLKIIAEFINSCGFMDVKILDPHSDVALALINNASKISSFEYVEKAIKERSDVLTPVLVAPDAGAYKKVWEFANILGLPLIGALKRRDLDGTINLQFMGKLLPHSPYLIVDDLADGGYTFVQLAKRLKDCGANNVSLYVTHGYFSKGFDELFKYIDHIYCTNSVKNITIYQDKITQFKVI